MKKFFLVLFGLLIPLQALGAISPLDKRLQTLRKEYEQGQVKCTDDKPLYVDGQCLACDEYNHWDDAAGVLWCEKCKNTSECFGNHCCLNCPQERPVLLSNGACVPCDYKPTAGSPKFDVVKGLEKCKKCPENEPVLLKTGGCKSCAQVLKEYKVLSRKNVLSGWEECSFEEKYKPNIQPPKTKKSLKYKVK